MFQNWIDGGGDNFVPAEDDDRLGYPRLDADILHVAEAGLVQAPGPGRLWRGVVPIRFLRIGTLEQRNNNNFKEAFLFSPFSSRTSFLMMSLTAATTAMPSATECS